MKLKIHLENHNIVVKLDNIEIYREKVSKILNILDKGGGIAHSVVASGAGCDIILTISYETEVILPNGEVATLSDLGW